MSGPTDLRDLFDRAVTLPAADRAPFLRRMCGHNAALRRQVEHLLAAHDRFGSIDETLSPEDIADLSARSSASGRLTLGSGVRLGPYEIIAPLAAGGMGDVYKARDTRLDRTVALKILPPELTGDPTARQRFEREARAVAALSHPHICPLFDVGRHADIEYLVMEFLDGETLAARLRRGKLPLDDALTYAIQIADALIAAHGSGIVHRDLKPGNIMLTPGGARLLDFGLAKRRQPALVGQTTEPESQLTRTGTILGTVQYMAPEQLDGREADERTDIFAFAVVLYEMLTGRRAFEGTSDAAVIGNILHGDPPAPSSLDRLTPLALDDLVRLCLAKNASARPQSMDDVRTRLSAIQPAALGPSVAQRSRIFLQRHWLLTTAAILMTLLLWGAVVWSRRNMPISSTGRASVQNLHIQPLTLLGDVSSGTISPDGKFIAYVRRHLGVYIRQITADNDVQVAPFVRGVDYDSVTFTPDGNFIDFAATEGSQRDLWRVPLLGGTRQKIVRQIWSSPGWSPDGQRMAFVRIGGADETSLVVVEADGTHERVLLTRRPMTFAFLNTSMFQFGTNRPAWSPDGKQIVLAAGLQPALPGAVFATGLIFVDAVTGAELRTLPMKGVDQLALEATWVEDGRVLVSGSTDLFSAPILWSVDLSSEHWTPVSRELAHLYGITLTTDHKGVVTTRKDRSSGIWLSSGPDEEGSFVVAETPASPGFPALDATGGIVYVANSGTGESTLYRYAAAASKPTIIARHFGGGFAVSPDGRFVVFSGNPSTPLYRVNADGSAPYVLVERNAGAPAVTRDSTTVLYSPYGAPGLYSIPIAGGTPQQLANLPVANQPSLSPDGRRLLAQLTEGGLSMLCDLPNCTNIRQLSLKSSQWAPDGQGVAFINDEDHGNLWEQRFDNGVQHALTHFADAQILEFGWSPDYKRLVLARGRLSNDLVLLTNLQ